MALTYVGNCEWEPSGNAEPKRPPNELPTLTEPWIGRSDKTDEFLAAHAIGSSYLGGYIIENTPKDNSPFQGVASVDLVIALEPDFNAYLAMPNTATKTACKTAALTASGIIEGESELKAERNVSFYAPETRYTYFSSTKPDGPRFDAVLSVAEPRILRSAVKVSANQKEVTFGGGNAPAALVAALTMAPWDKCTDHSAEPIPGTPWYRCTDVVTRELQGDQ